MRGFAAMVPAEVQGRQFVVATQAATMARLPVSRNDVGRQTFMGSILVEPSAFDHKPRRLSLH